MYISRDGVVGVVGGSVLCGADRGTARTLLFNSLPSEMPDAELYASQVEACIVADARNDRRAYMSMMFRLVFDLRAGSEHILANFPPSVLCRLSHRALDVGGAARDKASTHFSALLQHAEAAVAASEAASAAVPAVRTAVINRCPKCRATTNIQKVAGQLRSGDEGMTTQCMCGNCGATWHAR